MRSQLEVIDIIFEVFLKDRPWREIWSALGQRPVGKLVQFLLRLYAEVGISIGPDATQSVGPVKYGAFEILSQQGLRRSEPSDSRSNNANTFYVP